MRPGCKEFVNDIAAKMAAPAKAQSSRGKKA